VSSVDGDRDRVEIELLKGAVQRGLPFLGVCRGLQLVNVALGGGLYEDLLDQRPGSHRHDYFPEQPRDYLAHPVQVEPDSRLAQAAGEGELVVNSMHHQGIRGLAPGLRATACAPDGLIEAIELPEVPFGLAVQWHPECLLDQAPNRRLFQAFVQAASNEA
jgi:putative glutamine amidotransferase